MEESPSDNVLGSASLISLKPMIDSDGQPYLPLMYVFPMGQEELGVNQDSALVRPFHKALREGKPVGKINYVYYEDDGKHYVLGSFVHSPGGKIIFFPALLDDRLVKSSEGEILSRGIMHNVDHISLESNLRVYHMTLKQKALDGGKHPKYPRSNTTLVKDDVFLWFAMGVRDTGVLERAPKTQEIKLKGKTNAEIKRKSKFIEASRGGCRFHVTSVEDRPGDTYYINFEFFVSATRHRIDAPATVGIYHIGLSDYNTGTDERKNIMTRLHQIQLQGFPGSLWIRVSKIKGKLEEYSVLLSRKTN